jgi:hypothetical protein
LTTALNHGKINSVKSRERYDDVDMTTIKNTAIEKIIKLPEDEVSKVLIFIAGLEVGMRIVSYQPIESEDPVRLRTANQCPLPDSLANE